MCVLVTTHLLYLSVLERSLLSICCSAGVPTGVFGVEDSAATENNRHYILQTSIGWNYSRELADKATADRGGGKLDHTWRRRAAVLCRLALSNPDLPAKGGQIQSGLAGIAGAEEAVRRG